MASGRRLEPDQNILGPVKLPCISKAYIWKIPKKQNIVFLSAPNANIISISKFHVPKLIRHATHSTIHDAYHARYATFILYSKEMIPNHIKAEKQPETTTIFFLLGWVHSYLRVCSIYSFFPWSLGFILLMFLYKVHQAIRIWGINIQGKIYKKKGKIFIFPPNSLLGFENVWITWKWPARRLYCPKRYPISRVPTPISSDGRS